MYFMWFVRVEPLWVCAVGKKDEKKFFFEQAPFISATSVFLPGIENIVLAVALNVIEARQMKARLMTELVNQTGYSNNAT